MFAEISTQGAQSLTPLIEDGAGEQYTFTSPTLLASSTGDRIRA